MKDIQSVTVICSCIEGIYLYSYSSIRKNSVKLEVERLTAELLCRLYSTQKWGQMNSIINKQNKEAHIKRLGADLSAKQSTCIYD
jgi:hypothetical protein